MANTISKVVYGNRTLIDVSGDTVTPEKMYKGTTAHKNDGTIITGTAEAKVTGETLEIPAGLITVL